MLFIIQCGIHEHRKNGNEPLNAALT